MAGRQSEAILTGLLTRLGWAAEDGIDSPVFWEFCGGLRWRGDKTKPFLTRLLTRLGLKAATTECGHSGGWE